MKKRFIEIAVKMLVAALTAFATAIVSSRAHSIRNGDYHHQLHGSRTRDLLSNEGRPMMGAPLH